MVKRLLPLSRYVCLILILASGCSSNNSRYQQKHDSIPTRLPNASELLDATPRAEKPSRGGNKNYQVFGKHYQVLASAKDFSQTGTASWYGKKFHGHLTSNGEIYDMYAMTAAHKNLPLPSYVKVVNNSNGRSVIVRVNDRGPFHQNRIIDLSYSAAHKLDMLKTGTANVTITAITEFNRQHTNHLNNVSINQDASKTIPSLTPTRSVIAVTNSNAKNTKASKKQYIQVFASKSNNQAKKLANTLTTEHKINTTIEQKNGIFRVLVGPINNENELNKLLLEVKANGHPKAFIRQ